MTLILTMAGAGSRFKKSGYDKEKYEIPFRGHSLLEWSLASLINFRDQDLVIVSRRFAQVEAFVSSVAVRLGFKSPKIVFVEAVTRGQAESAALAASCIDPDQPVIIYNTDTYVEPFAWHPGQIRGAGWIPCFLAVGDKWSFVDADADGLARRTAEKTRISDHCSVGLYYFRHFHYLLDNLPGQTEELCGGEWYVAPIYNKLIGAGLPVYLHELPQAAVHVLGTPEDLEAAAADLRFPDLDRRQARVIKAD